MPVKRRKGSPYWHYDFTIKGNRFRGSCETDDKQAAQAVEAALRRDVLLGVLTNKKPRATLDEAFGRYWLDVGHGASNAKTIEIQGKRLLKYLGKNKFLDELTNRNVADYVSRRRGDRDPRHKKTVKLIGPATVNRELTLLRSVLIMARDKLDVEVAAINWKAHWLQEPDQRTRTLRKSELDRLLKECAEHLRAPVTFSLLTGVRLANCIKLDWSQVDLPAREIRFRVKSRKPGGKLLEVPISEPCLVLLAGLAPKDNGPVFTREHRGKQVAIKTWKTAWTGAKRRAGISDLRWHDLRHTAATWMVDADVPLDVVQKILGHENIETTQRYAHRSDDAKRRALETLGHTYGTKTQQEGGKRGNIKAVGE